MLIFSVLFSDSVTSETAFLEDFVLGIGDTLEMSCNLEDLSEPVVWFKDDTGLVSGNRTRVGQRMLRIINVSYEDSGVYTCRLAHTNTLISNYTIRVTGEITRGISGVLCSAVQIQKCFAFIFSKLLPHFLAKIQHCSMTAAHFYSYRMLSWRTIHIFSSTHTISTQTHSRTHALYACGTGTGFQQWTSSHISHRSPLLIHNQR